jgi:hypothetical protein
VPLESGYARIRRPARLEEAAAAGRGGWSVALPDRLTAVTQAGVAGLLDYSE